MFCSKRNQNLSIASAKRNLMESSSTFFDYLSFFLLRPVLAISFVVCFIALWWFLAWKLVLSHVPLVQEIFGLKKKTFKPKPESRGRLSKFYKSINPQNHLT